MGSRIRLVSDADLVDEKLPDLKFTGLACPSCQRAVACLVYELPRTLVFACPACGNWWSASEPGVRPH